MPPSRLVVRIDTPLPQRRMALLKWSADSGKVSPAAAPRGDAEGVPRARETEYYPDFPGSRNSGSGCAGSGERGRRGAAGGL